MVVGVVVIKEDAGYVWAFIVDILVKRFVDLWQRANEVALVIVTRFVMLMQHEIRFATD